MFEDKCVKTRGYTGLLSLGFWETMKLTEPLLIAQMWGKVFLNPFVNWKIHDVKIKMLLGKNKTKHQNAAWHFKSTAKHSIARCQETRLAKACERIGESEGSEEGVRRHTKPHTSRCGIPAFRSEEGRLEDEETESQRAVTGELAAVTHYSHIRTLLRSYPVSLGHTEGWGQWGSACCLTCGWCAPCCRGELSCTVK